MIRRFGEFDLDEGVRELRLRGREVPLQPRVFDVLAYLVNKRDHLVTKEELLEKLWPDAVVADGALQRAVSLARSALRQGNMESAIQTRARAGYRFVAEVVEARDHPAGPSEAIRAARAAFERGAWDDACSRFAAAASDLTAPDLERWGRAAHAASRWADAIPPLERAVASYRESGDLLGAARAALALAQVHFDVRALPVAKGWRSRAERFLQGQPETREHGLLACQAARIAMYEGDQAEALAQADRGLELARRFEDPDIEVLALVNRGTALLATGRLEEGLAAHDEAAAAVLAGGVDAWHGGYTFCGVIWGSINRNDWARAGAWTQQFTRWCEHNAAAGFPGLCQLHRAEVLVLHGQLVTAEEEVEQAQEVLAAAAPWAEGDAFRLLGDIRLVRRDLDGAELAYRRARELGWDPEPGFALLLVARGRHPEAVRALQQALHATTWTSGQRKAILLGHLAIVAQAAGDPALATSALQQLEARPEVAAVPAVAALLSRARAELAAAAGRSVEAAGLLRQSLAVYAELKLPLLAAQTRMRLAQFLSEAGDTEGAAIELSAARALLGPS